MKLGEKFDLKINDVIEIDDGLEIELKNIVTEEIVSAPEDEKNYPAGTGISVNIRTSFEDSEEHIVLNKLPEGYTSKNLMISNGHLIELVDCTENSVTLKVTKAE